MTQNSFLATKTSKDILKDLFNSLITILLDQRLSLLHDGPQVVRSVNVMIVKIMEKSDYTNCLCALIKSLQECVGSETCSPKFLELIMKVSACGLKGCEETVSQCSRGPKINQGRFLWDFDFYVIMQESLFCLHIQWQQ